MNFATFLLEQSRHNTADAVITSTERITHDDLYIRVQSLARHLVDRYGSGNEFLLLAENSPFFVIAYLAIIQSGNVAMLIETRISPEQLAEVVAGCSIRAFFVDERHRHKVTTPLDLISETLLDTIPVVEESVDPELSENALAAIIFTSGSTGAKKGVMLTHRNLCANTASIAEYFHLTEHDRIAVVLPFFYCFGASLLHTHLRVGGSVVLSNHIFLGAVLRDLQRYECTGFAGVPSTYQILIQKTPFLRETFPHLRYFAQAGGPLADRYIRQIVGAFPDKEFFVMYGATEATARLSYLPPDVLGEKICSIGRGIPGVVLEVIDEGGNPVRPGEIGEITARGENIMVGYYRDPEGTAEVLHDGRLYTGDLATVDDEGYIYVTGRKKNIIKSGGYRISPNEIERFIAAQPGVFNCVVFSLPDEIMGEAVTVAVQPEGKPSEELRAKLLAVCNSHFPSYKVPRHLFFVSDFPLNSSNKVDRARLVEMATARLFHPSPKSELPSDLEGLLKLPPYSLTDAEREHVLLPLLRQRCIAAVAGSRPIRNLFDKCGVDPTALPSLEEIPFVPVQMFKRFDLATVPSDKVVKVLRSSGTTSTLQSRIPLTKLTVMNQIKSLTAILKDSLGDRRRVFLVIDHEGINDPLLEFSARTAGVRGLSVYAKRILYLLREEEGHLVLNLPAIEALAELEETEVYAFGFTYIIWSTFYQQIRLLDRSFRFKDFVLFHGGGWKKMRDAAVSKERFEREVGELFGVGPDRVKDFYGMAEQTGIIFVDCECGNKHVPNVGQVIFRDPQTLRPCAPGEVGMIEVMSVLADSYYSAGLLTEDLGVLLGIDDCPCGRKGRYFRFTARMERTESRGCGDTFRE